MVGADGDAYMKVKYQFTRTVAEAAAEVSPKLSVTVTLTEMGLPAEVGVAEVYVLLVPV
jgi:hypothetical protein